MAINSLTVRSRYGCVQRYFNAASRIACRVLSDLRSAVSPFRAIRYWRFFICDILLQIYDTMSLKANKSQWSDALRITLWFYNMLSQIWDNSVLTLSNGRDDVFYPDVWYIHHSLSFISILSNYNIYHTNLILLNHFDALSIDLKSTIPRSTLSIWKRRDISRIIGCESLSGNDVSVLKEIAKSKNLLRAAKNRINLHPE